MTCYRNTVLLTLAGITFLGLAGCGTQPYKPWQPGDNWWNIEKTQAEAEPGETAEMAATAEKMQPAPAVVVTEPVSASPSMMDEKPGMSPTSQMSTSSSTTGDVLLLDSMQNTTGVQSPRNGMNMAAVRQQYGDPISEGKSVGDPPIARWEYEGFSVYFEYDLVLHSVIRRPNQN